MNVVTFRMQHTPTTPRTPFFSAPPKSRIIDLVYSRKIIDIGQLRLDLTLEFRFVQEVDITPTTNQRRPIVCLAIPAFNCKK